MLDLFCAISFKREAKMVKLVRENENCSVGRMAGNQEAIPMMQQGYQQYNDLPSVTKLDEELRLRREQGMLERISKRSCNEISFSFPSLDDDDSEKSMVSSESYSSMIEIEIESVGSSNTSPSTVSPPKQIALGLLPSVPMNCIRPKPQRFESGQLTFGTKKQRTSDWLHDPLPSRSIRPRKLIFPGDKVDFHGLCFLPVRSLEITSESLDKSSTSLHGLNLVQYQERPQCPEPSQQTVAPRAA